MLQLTGFYPIDPTPYHPTEVVYGMVRTGYSAAPGDPDIEYQKVKHLLSPKVSVIHRLPKEPQIKPNAAGLKEAPHFGLSSYLKLMKEVPDGIL